MPKFEAAAGSLVIGPANAMYAGPERLNSVYVHLNSEWNQYDLPGDDE